MERQTRVKNQLRISTMYPVLAGYFFAVVGLYGVMDQGGPVAFAALGLVLYLGGSMLASWMIYQHELAKVWADPHEFRRHLPFRSYGMVVRSFQHVFYAEADVLMDVQRAIKAELVRRGLARNFRVTYLTDADGDLTAKEGRPFCLATATTAPRSAAVTVAIHPQMLGNTQCISWWIMAAGFVDQDRVFRFVTLAPLTMPFWLAGYLKNRVDVIGLVRNLHQSFYRDLDLTATARALQEAMQGSLTATLAQLGLDTTELQSGIRRVQTRPGEELAAGAQLAAGAELVVPVEAVAPIVAVPSVAVAGGAPVRPAPAPPLAWQPWTPASPQPALLPMVPEDEEVTRPMGQPMPVGQPVPVGQPMPEGMGSEKPRTSSAIIRRDRGRSGRAA